jgi:putative oxidoreductase
MKDVMTTYNQSNPLRALSYADGLAESTSDIILLIGRILLGWIFVRSGYGKLFDMGAYATMLQGRGISIFLAYTSVLVEFFGGIALILGFATRYVTLVMIAFMVVATFTSHRYWQFADVSVRRIQELNFYKNLAMMGGFCFLFVCNSKRFSIDAWLRTQS